MAEGDCSSWSDSSDGSSRVPLHRLPSKGEAKQWCGRGDEKGVVAEAGARCRRRRQHHRYQQQGAASPTRCGGTDHLALKGGFTRGEDSPEWEEAIVVFSPRDARRNSRKKS